MQTVSFANVRDVLNAFSISDEEIIAEIMDAGFSDTLANTRWAIIETETAMEMLWDGFMYVEMDMDRAQFEVTFASAAEGAAFMNVIYWQ